MLQATVSSIFMKKASERLLQNVFYYKREITIRLKVAPENHVDSLRARQAHNIW
jgi:hypothetical protein